jgi:hypothetical protein
MFSPSINSSKDALVQFEFRLPWLREINVVFPASWACALHSAILSSSKIAVEPK